MERLDNMDAVEAETKEHFEEIYPDNGKDIGNVLYTITKEQVRKMILDDGIRPDNRKRTEIRPIWCDTHVLPRTHGSGLFKRGQTQVLSVATVGPLSEAQTIDGINEQTEERSDMVHWRKEHCCRYCRVRKISRMRSVSYRKCYPLMDLLLRHRYAEAVWH